MGGASRPASGTSRGPVLTSGLRTFAVVDAILVVTFVILLVMALVSGSLTAPQASPATTPPVDQAESTPDASAPEAPVAPEELTAFVLPSGNIWCTMTPSSATCTILAFTFTAPAVPADCAGTVGNVLTIEAEGEPQMPCVTTPPSAAPEGTPVLEYGSASSVGRMTCHSSTNGATCRSTTGRGFSVARGGYTFL